jgi:hypothetical protein
MDGPSNRDLLAATWFVKQVFCDQSNTWSCLLRFLVGTGNDLGYHLGECAEEPIAGAVGDRPAQGDVGEQLRLVLANFLLTKLIGWAAEVLTEVCFFAMIQFYS